MNPDLDVIRTLVDYHDHIAAPPVPLTADLERGRRRVRRNRGLKAGAAALGVICVAGILSLVIGARASEDSLPVGPPTGRTTTAPAPDGPGLRAPLIAPESLIDVRELGFRVAPVAGFDPEGLQAGWSVDEDGHTVTLRWDEVADAVHVTVLHHGEPPPLDPSVWDHVEAVRIHGVAGTYVERDGGRYGIDGGFEAALAWEYAPGSWAHVWTRSDRGDPGQERLRSALIAVAEAVGPGGEPLRLPIRTGAFPPSMPALSTFSGAGVHMGRNGWETTLAFDWMRIVVGPGTARETCQQYGGGIETFTYEGYPGCLSGEGSTDQPPAGTSFNFIHAVVLQVEGTVRTVVPSVRTGEGPEYPIKDLKQMLAQLTVAPLDDTSTWVDPKTALGN